MLTNLNSRASTFNRLVGSMIVGFALTVCCGFTQHLAAENARRIPVEAKPIVKEDSINNPELVREKSDGSILLTAENGKGIGPDIKYMPEWKAFGWFTAADRVEWDVNVKRAGEFEAYLSWSVSDEEAGKPFILEVGDQRITGDAGKTGSWETFRTEKIGRIMLAKGKQRVVFRPGSVFGEGGALLDLREIKLVRVK